MDVSVPVIAIEIGCEGKGDRGAVRSTDPFLGLLPNRSACMEASR